MSRLLLVLTASAILVGNGACRTSRAPDLVFVSSEDAGEVSVIDVQSDRVVRTIAVGKRPRGLRVSPDGTLLFVALSGSSKSPPGAPEPEPAASRDDDADGIGVIDIARGALLRTLDAGRDPESFDVSADGATLFVSNEESAQLSIVDVASGEVRGTVAVGREPEGVAVAPDGMVYVTCEVDVVDPRARTVVARLQSSGRPRAVAFFENRALVTAETGGMLESFALASHAATSKVRTGEGRPRPMGLAVSRDGSRAFVGNGRDGSVAIVDLATEPLDRVLPNVGQRVWGLGSPATRCMPQRCPT